MLREPSDAVNSLSVEGIIAEVGWKPALVARRQELGRIKMIEDGRSISSVGGGRWESLSGGNNRRKDTATRQVNQG